MAAVLRSCRFIARLLPILCASAVLGVTLLGPLDITTQPKQSNPEILALGLDGSHGLLDNTIASTTTPMPLVPIGAIAAADVTLGAPVQQSAVTLGDCSFGPLCWVGSAVYGFGRGVADSVGRIPDLILKPIGNIFIECTPHGFTDFFGLDRLARCALAFGKLFAGVAGWAISTAISLVFNTLYDSFVNATQWMVNLTFKVVLSDAKFVSPQLTCGFQDITNKECISRWFLTQVGLMHIIGLNIIVPLLLLVIMQSVLKGSMFFLLRAMLVMLPAAIVGGVVAVVFAQLLLNIVDQMCNFLIWGSMTNNDMAAGFDEAFEKMRTGSFGLASVLWMLAMIIASFIILIELVLRQVAVYLAALFVPVAFATMVYPPTVRWARRALEILVAFIFMKLFLVGGLLLGLAAFTYNVGVATPNGTGAGLSEADQGMTTIITGTALFFFAAFATTKMMAPLPVGGGVSSDSRIVKPEQGFAAGDLTQTRLSNRLRRLQDRANGIRGGQKMVLSSSSDDDLPDASDSPSSGGGGSSSGSDKDDSGYSGGTSGGANPGGSGANPGAKTPIEASSSPAPSAKETETVAPAPAPPMAITDDDDVPDDGRIGTPRKRAKPVRPQTTSKPRPPAKPSKQKQVTNALRTIPLVDGTRVAVNKLRQHQRAEVAPNRSERVVVDGVEKKVAPTPPPAVRNAPPPNGRDGNG